MKSCKHCGKGVDKDDEYGDYFVPGEVFPNDMHCEKSPNRGHEVKK